MGEDHGREAGRAGPPTDWSSGERVFGPPGGTVDTDWLVPVLLEREPVDPGRAAAVLAEAWSALRAEAAIAGVPAAQVDRVQVLRRLGLSGPPGAAPPPERDGDRLRRVAVDVVCAAGRLYDAR